jgi:hypothetical protein
VTVQKIPIFVVSLARAADRRAAMTRHLGELGLSFEITEAVDGRALSPAELASMTVPKLPLSPGDIGCYLSHINIYRRMVAQDIPIAMVMEDDAALNPAFAPVLRDGIRQPDFDICFVDSWFVGLKGRIYYDRADWLEIGHGFTAYRFAPPPHGTQAYLITLETARHRVAVALPITQSIDWYENLPPDTRYYGLIEPRGAWLNEAFSVVSYVSPKATRNAQPWHMQWRRWAPWYDFWNAVHPSMIAARRQAPKLMAAGILPPARRWRPIPPSIAGGGPVRSPAGG